MAVTICETNAPVDAGEVVADLENASAATTNETVRLVVGNDPEVVETRSVTVEGNESEMITMRFETARVENEPEFSIPAETADDADQESVLVYRSR